jgi:hypothetical protein
MAKIKTKKDKRITFRMTDLEHLKVQFQALKNNQTISEYLRSNLK